MQKRRERLYYSSEKFIEEAIKGPILFGIDVNWKDTEGNTFLHLLCKNNLSDQLIDAIKLLIQFGIEVNGKDNFGRNALHFLSANHSSEIIINAIKTLITNLVLTCTKLSIPHLVVDF